MNEKAFRELVSGERHGLQAAALRLGLGLLAAVYGIAVWLRAAGFRCGLYRVRRCRVPVISIGNLTTGGTGKTPLVAWLAGWCRSQGWQAGLLSRGYRSDESGNNDEKRLLDQLCPGVPHLQQPDRVSAARTAIDEHHCNVLLLDDGFQHRRLHRNLDLVLIDATCPFGYGRLLPRGLLREPPSALARSSLVVLTRAEQVTPEERETLHDRLVQLAGHDRVVAVAFRATGLINSIGETGSLEQALELPVAAFCGIGNPAAFFNSLETVVTRSFDDHHTYTDDDLDSLGRWANEHGARALVTTRKDLVKIPRTELADVPLWAVETEVEFLSGRGVLENVLAGIVTELTDV